MVPLARDHPAIGTVRPVRILVTNDDGIDSVGLHELARALVDLGEVTVVAPDTEYSGAGASLGAMHLIRPEVHDAHIDGIDQSWSVSGPPGLCVVYSRLGLFGDSFDLVVAGINRGPNTGRSTLFSGTIGAVLAGERFGWSGMAVSADVPVTGGTGAVGAPGHVHWETAAAVAQVILPWLVDAPQRTVLNLNAPDVPLAELQGIRWAGLASVGGVRTVITGRDDTGLGEPGEQRARPG